MADVFACAIRQSEVHRWTGADYWAATLLDLYLHRERSARSMAECHILSHRGAGRLLLAGIMAFMHASQGKGGTLSHLSCHLATPTLDLYHHDDGSGNNYNTVLPVAVMRKSSDR